MRNSRKNAKHDDGISNPNLVERLEDGKRCRFCGHDGVVPVKDRKTDRSHRRGNPYRLVCVACERHLCMTSKEEWEEHEDRFVLPTESDDPIPVFDCPNCGVLVEGQPNECPECGMSYTW